jgi:MOSC domain-containing protein YiiM
VTGLVVAVSSSPRHRFSKQPQPSVRLLEGIGVEGDSHAGATVQHRSRKRWRPQDPNLRQVHLLQEELLDELTAGGYEIAPGDVGENVLTRGVDLLGLPTGTRLRLGPDAVVTVTGLRNPCVQMDRFADGLMAAVLDRDENGELVRKAGVMAVVTAGGSVAPGDVVGIELPAPPYLPLKAV